jgi:hypothetical protein
MRLTLGLDVAAPSHLAWLELIELTSWPHWGPTVRAARLHDGGERLHAGATGSVQTPVGLWLPFRVHEWQDQDPRRSWSWRVGGVPATSHTVISRGDSWCRVEMSVPLLAPAYLAVVAPALGRIRDRAERRARH